MRTKRAVAALIRSLMLGSTTTAFVVLSAVTTVGCKDESQPEYWIEKLDDSAWRARAVNRLAEMFEGVISRSNKDLKAPAVQEFVNKTIDPLMKLYTEQYELLDSKSRVTTIKLLADFRDKRTEPALKKAFESFAKSPKTSRDETDIKWAAQAQEELKLEGLSVPLLEAFMKLRASSMLGGVSYRDVNEAMKAQPPNKAWVDPLIAKLEAEITPVNNKDKNSFDDARDQVFWQTTAAEALGRIGDPKAVEPLFKVLLDPTKADVAYTAGLALVKLGKPAADLAVKLSKGEQEKLQAFQLRRIKEVTGNEEKGKPWIGTAAKVLGASSRPEAGPALIGLIEAEQDETLRAIFVDELSRVPGTAETKEAFKKAFVKLPVKFYPGLAESAGRFGDADFVPWMLETADSVKGEQEERELAQQSLVQTALKLAKPSQMGDVKAAIAKHDADRAKSLLAKVEPLVAKCQENASCYLEALKSPENQSEANQFVGIKAGYMTAIFGNEQTRDQLVASLRPITNASLRHVAGQTIDLLTPKGSKAVAEKLRAIIDENAKSPDKDRSAGDNSLKQVMYRLEARAG
ncbi:MAG TPA: HEAT repeat domain-containing protein [Polyangiaceae bacterium]